MAALVLSRIGPSAKQAVPHLLEIYTNETEKTLRISVAFAIQKITGNSIYLDQLRKKK